MFDFRNLASQITYSMKKHQTQKHPKQNCQKEGSQTEHLGHKNQTPKERQVFDRTSRNRRKIPKQCNATRDTRRVIKSSSCKQCRQNSRHDGRIGCSEAIQIAAASPSKPNTLKPKSRSEPHRIYKPRFKRLVERKKFRTQPQNFFWTPLHNKKKDNGRELKTKTTHGKSLDQERSKSLEGCCL